MFCPDLLAQCVMGDEMVSNRVTPAKCHPERQNKAKGLCHPCYAAKRRAEAPHKRKGWTRAELEANRRVTSLGNLRRCTGCRSWWPTEPEPDGDGRPVMFWFEGKARCRACEMERNRDDWRRRRAA